MMILGAIFRCLEPTLTAAACLSSKPLFLNPMEKRDEATAWERFPKWITCVLMVLSSLAVERNLRPLGAIC